MKKIVFALCIIIGTFYYLAPHIKNNQTAIAQQTMAVADNTDNNQNGKDTKDRNADKKEDNNDDKADEQNKKAKDNKTGKEYELAAYISDRPEQILRHSAMTISWNRSLGVPNYVAWQLTDERTKGNSKRANDFQPDPLIEDSPVWADYRQSGYDRGHMCPAADNKHSDQAQRECFYMTNMCPQTHTLNAGDWSQIEDLCRRWAHHYGTVYIASGPIINGYPTDKNPQNERIGTRRVIVPDAFFKVVMRRGEYGAKAIGFVCPNGTQNLDPRDYAVSVDSVETLTGINFFSRLPKKEERKAEATFEIKDWKGL